MNKKKRCQILWGEIKKCTGENISFFYWDSVAGVYRGLKPELGGARARAWILSAIETAVKSLRASFFFISFWAFYFYLSRKKAKAKRLAHKDWKWAIKEICIHIHSQPSYFEWTLFFRQSLPTNGNFYSFGKRYLMCFFLPCRIHTDGQRVATKSLQLGLLPECVTFFCKTLVTEKGKMMG